jgi:hypothetical protein
MRNINNPLHESFKVSHIAKRYFDKVIPGNKLTKESARSRYSMSLHLIDLNVLHEVIEEVYHEQLNKF